MKHLQNLLLALLIILASFSTACSQAPGNQSDIDWLIEVLQLQKGSVVADIGAGDGDQTLTIAKYIGPDGKMYSTELGALDELRRAIKKSDQENITVIKGHPSKTNLPTECCNALYMRRVYHHIDNPEAFNASLYKSLKPGGRLAIIDFEPRSSEAEPQGRDQGSQHGVMAETVVQELTNAGFVDVDDPQTSGRNFYVVFQKPAE